MLMNLETPENKEQANETAESLWASMYAESFKLNGSDSKATKDADKAVKKFRERFK